MLFHSSTKISKRIATKNILPGGVFLPFSPLQKSVFERNICTYRRWTFVVIYLIKKRLLYRCCQYMQK